MPLSEMDDLSWGLDLTGVLVGEIKERADPGLVKLQIVEIVLYIRIQIQLC
jgi:hypothetical protein